MSRFQRKEDTRKPNRVIFIYTEGKETEPNYFSSIRSELRIPGIEIIIHGKGDHTLPLVEHVIAEKNRDTEDSEWWVVIDKDSHSHFNEAIEKAKSNKINVAYSNESFELWIILHYERLSAALGRAALLKKAASLTGFSSSVFKKSDVYSIIKGKELVAIRNAKSLDKTHDTEGEKSYEKRNPSTTVYLLVESLRKLANN